MVMLSHLREARYYSYYSRLQMKDALGRQVGWLVQGLPAGE